MKPSSISSLYHKKEADNTQNITYSTSLCVEMTTED